MNTYLTQKNNITWATKFLALGLIFTLFTPLMAQAFVTTTDFPLSVTNMIPNASTSGTITLENQIDDTQDAQIEVTSSLAGDLSNNMTVTITGGTPYTDSLTNFYNAGPVLLGSVAGNNTIALTLTITLNDDAPQSLMGQATNFNFCIGFAGSEVSCGTAFATVTNNNNRSGSRSSATRLQSRTLAPVPPGDVLGATDSVEQCTEYLQGYVRPGAVNNAAEVTRLQEFLRDLGGFPALTVTGFYDEASIAAVRSFQSSYRSTILAPWGISEPTGYVYFTTRKVINEVRCSFTELFPLTEAQLIEIARVRLAGNAWTPESAGGIVSASLGGATTETSRGEVAGISTSSEVAVESSTEINNEPSDSDSNDDKPSFFARIWNWITGWF